MPAGCEIVILRPVSSFRHTLETEDATGGFFAEKAISGRSVPTYMLTSRFPMHHNVPGGSAAVEKSGAGRLTEAAVSGKLESVL